MIKGDKRNGSITVFNCHKLNGAFPFCWSFLGYTTPCWTLLLSTHMPSYSSVTIHALPGRNSSFYGTKMQDNAGLDSNHLSFSSLNSLLTSRLQGHHGQNDRLILLSWLHGHTYTGTEDLQLVKSTAYPIFKLLRHRHTAAHPRKNFRSGGVFKIFLCANCCVVCSTSSMFPRRTFASWEKRGFIKEGQWSLAIDPCSVLAASIQHAKWTWTLVFQISWTTLVNL